MPVNPKMSLRVKYDNDELVLTLKVTHNVKKHRPACKQDVVRRNKLSSDSKHACKQNIVLS